MSGEIGFEIQMNYPYEDVLERTKEALEERRFWCTNFH